MALELVPFSSLAGVPVRWEKHDPRGLGNPGRRKIAPEFMATLNRAFEALWSGPWGRAMHIVSGGAYVDRPITKGDRHAIGTALDLFSIGWPSATVYACEADKAPRPYIAVEAVLRQHIPQVLDWWSDERHHSHWHLDDRSQAWGFSAIAAADVCYLQAALRHVWKCNPGAIDGALGPKTIGAWRKAANLFGHPGDEPLSECWWKFLRETAARGFGT